MKTTTQQHVTHAFLSPDIVIRPCRGQWLVEQDGRFLYWRELQSDAIDCALDYARVAARGKRPYRVLLRTTGGAIISVAGTPSQTYAGRVIDLAEERRKRRGGADTAPAQKTAG